MGACKREKRFRKLAKEFFIHVEQFRRVAKAFFTDFDPVANLRRCFSCIFDLSPTGDSLFRA